MAERAARNGRAARPDALVTPADRFNQLLESVAELASTGPAAALGEVLRETDRLIARERERFDVDPTAAPTLLAMQHRLLEVSRTMEAEQQRIVRDLAALQASAQMDSPYGTPRPAAIALDRLG